MLTAEEALQLRLCSTEHQGAPSKIPLVLTATGTRMNGVPATLNEEGDSTAKEAFTSNPSHLHKNETRALCTTAGTACI